jgi:transcription antitermination factor NusG
LQFLETGCSKKQIRHIGTFCTPTPAQKKKLPLELQKKGYEVFLPLQKTLKTWSDRKKWVEEPLFKSYLFIETELEANYYTILNTPGIVKFISFQSHPAIVDPREINLVKLLVRSIILDICRRLESSAKPISRR